MKDIKRELTELKRLNKEYDKLFTKLEREYDKYVKTEQIRHLNKANDYHYNMSQVLRQIRQKETFIGEHIKMMKRGS